jgi:competence protein ComEC
LLAVALGALLGVCWIQTRQALPDSALLAGLCLSTGCFLTIAWAGARLALRSESPLLAQRCHVLWLSTLLLAVSSGLFAFRAADDAAAGLSSRLSAAMDGRSVWLEVVVRDLPTLQERGWRFEAEVRLARVAPDGPVISLPKRGLMFWPKGVMQELPENLSPGQRWGFEARIRQPHGTLNPQAFDAEAWMMEQGFHFVGSVKTGKYASQPHLLGMETDLGLRIDQMRDRIRELIGAHSQSSAVGVLSALVVGDQRAIGVAEWAVFRKTGVSHLMSISGLHVTMFAAMAAAVGAALWRALCLTRLAAGLWIPVQSVAAGFAIVGAVGYALLAGFAIPAQRTALMVTVLGLARILGVQASSYSVLALAMLVVLMAHPMAVLSVGFWLSFIAVGFLFTLGEGQTTRRHAGYLRRCLDSLQRAAYTQWAITLGLLPLTIFFFQQVSLVGPIANALAIPVVSFVVTPLAMAGVVEAACMGSAWLLGIAAGFQERLFEFLAWSAAHPFAVLDWPGPGWPAAAVATIGMVMVFGKCLHGRVYRWRHIGWLGLFALCLPAVTAPAEGEMRVTLMDVGQGSAVLIRTRDHTVLFDTGPVMGQSDAAERVILPTLRRYGVRRIDHLVISHADQDHSGGLASLLLAMPTASVAAPEFESLEESLRHASPEAVAAMRLRPTLCRAGQKWSLNGVDFQFLHPSTLPTSITPTQRNRYSCVLRVESADGGSLLLAGDIPLKTDRELVGRFIGLQDPENPEALALVGTRLASQVLVAPHHGSKTSLSEDLLRAVAPQFVVIQAGYRNRFGHPHQETLDRIARAQVNAPAVLRTDLQGAIELRWSAGQLMQWDFWRDHRRWWHLNRAAEPML